jgi:magnesium chelatase family protein
MTSARTYSAALTGITGHILTADADISNGLPGIILAGLPDTVLREARDRVRAAILNSGQPWPGRRITVSLSPATLPKHGSGTDLAIAIAVLAADGSVPPKATAGVMFLAELGLDGQLRPVSGTVPAVIAAAAAGLTTIVVADANAAEAAVVPGVRVMAADRLAAVTGWLRTGDPALIRETPPSAATVTSLLPDGTCPDLADVAGQAQARRALEICAAGGHHLSLTGPPGSDAVPLAERLPGIMPPLDRDAALEVTSIRSAAGLLTPDGGLIARPPFIAPHHSSSKAMIIGCGTSSPRPGAVSLAHRGVLFLDQAPEFSRDVLDALRQPLETGQVTVARHGITVTFPARVTLVLTAHSCPCTAGPPDGCTCSTAARRRYLGRLSGPLLDLIDVKATVHPPDPAEPRRLPSRAESSAPVAVRVLAARDRAARRLAATPWRVNAQVPAAGLRRHWAPSPDALRGVERAAELGQISDRGVAKVIRVAWTITDLAGNDRPGRDECEDALRCWLGVAQ